MPLPIYIICSESGTEDRYTGLMSHFNVLEKFLLSKIDPSKVSQLPQPAPAIPLGRIRVVSVWMKMDEESEDDEFEYSLDVVLPPDGKRTCASTGKFKFTKPLYRIQINLIGQPPIEGSGVLWIECNVRQLASDSWMAQRYPIIIELQSNESNSS